MHILTFQKVEKIRLHNKDFLRFYIIIFSRYLYFLRFEGERMSDNIDYMENDYIVY